MRIAILMTCFNRKALTLQCLDALAVAIRRYNAANPSVFDLWLNDDGSTDGTSAAVQGWHRENNPLSTTTFSLHLICGSGSDYWCGGMRRAWESAVGSGREYDGFLWLNDDSMLVDTAFETLFADRLSCDRVQNAILVGALCGRDGKTASYGGEDGSGFVVPDGTWHPIRQMNGNVVWVPRSVYKKIGGMRPCWTHAIGDGDYSRTACEHGIKVLLTPSFVAVCDKNPNTSPWRNPNVRLWRRMKNLYSPLGHSEPWLLFRYCLIHDGLLVAVRNYIAAHVRVLFPGMFR